MLIEKKYMVKYYLRTSLTCCWKLAGLCRHWLNHTHYRQYVFYFRSSNLTFVSLISYSYLSYIFWRDRFQYFIFKRTVDYPTKRKYFWMKFYEYIAKSDLSSVYPNIISCLFMHVLKQLAYFWQFWSNYFIFSEMFKLNWQFGLSDSLIHNCLIFSQYEANDFLAYKINKNRVVSHNCYFVTWEYMENHSCTQEYV